MATDGYLWLSKMLSHYQEIVTKYGGYGKITVEFAASKATVIRTEAVEKLPQEPEEVDRKAPKSL